MNNSIVEISKKTSKAGRTPIKLILHEIYKDDSEYNKNGISWTREYVEQNMDSVKGMCLVAQFLDDEKTIPFGGHGNMIVEENKVVFEDSLVVGSFEDVYIAEGIEINNRKIDALVGVGYVYDQRFPSLVDYLQEQYDNGNPVEGSIEINADKSKGNTKIIYDGGWKEKGRKPQVYQYSGHALTIGVAPADDSALMIELNHYKNEVNKDLPNVEINELSYDDIATIITRTFNKMMESKTNTYHWYGIYKFYPQSQTVVMIDYDTTPYKYYQTNYNITDNKVEIGEIVEVEMTWTPSNDESAIEVNTSLIKDILTKNKGGKSKVNEDKILELNSKVEELTSKLAELNQTVVEANKALEAKNNEFAKLEEEKNSMIEELNSLKVFKEEKDKEAKQAEVNAYFESEVKKNGFSEEEINSLKTEYVDKMDLEGLKLKEAELCVKKVKELNSIQSQTELNSQNNSDLFMSIHNTEKSDTDYSDLF